MLLCTHSLLRSPTRIPRLLLTTTTTFLAILSSLVLLLLLLPSPASGGGDVYSSVVDLENLLRGEAEATSAVIAEYVRMESARLQHLENYAKKLTSQSYRERNVEDVKNPVTAYLLIKRLISDWKRVKELMMSSSSAEHIDKIVQTRMTNGVHYPDEDDVEGAALSLIRLQDTYQLKTTDLASGVVAGMRGAKEMGAEDCFDVVKAAHNSQDYFHAVEWGHESLKRIPKEHGDDNATSAEVVAKADVLDYLAYALYRQNNWERALAMRSQIAQLDPLHPRTHSSEIPEQHEQHQKVGTTQPLPPLRNYRDHSPHSDKAIFDRLCRGEQVPVFKGPTETAAPPLYCYLKRDRPFLVLAPIKVEIVHHDPLVVLFRQVISAGEIEVVKQLATPKLTRAGTLNVSTGATEYNYFRVSKHTWLFPYHHEVMVRLEKRVDLMTNLNQETAEAFQIANYGIGGHYGPHYDFDWGKEKKAFAHLNVGDRIATVLFYMSQPTMGGATVFTELRTGVFPSERDALFWYNIKRDGEADYRTKHAACPVLTGVKWVSNKWIHERGQEIRRPCGLTPTAHEKFVGDLAP